MGAVLVACLFNVLSILLVSRYLFVRFSRERLAYAAEVEAQASRRRQQQRDIESGLQGSMQAQLARFTPILVLQPDSKVCLRKSCWPWSGVESVPGILPGASKRWTQTWLPGALWSAGRHIHGSIFLDLAAE